MFANSLGEADIIHEVNIISDSDIICRRQTSLKKVLFERTGLFSGWFELNDTNKLCLKTVWRNVFYA
jgi:hypothetical protein